MYRTPMTGQGRRQHFSKMHLSDRGICRARWFAVENHLRYSSYHWYELHTSRPRNCLSYALTCTVCRKVAYCFLLVTSNTTVLGSLSTQSDLLRTLRAISCAESWRALSAQYHTSIMFIVCWRGPIDCILGPLSDGRSGKHCTLQQNTSLCKCGSTRDPTKKRFYGY